MNVHDDAAVARNALWVARCDAATKALIDWDFESFGNDRDEHFRIAAARALSAADAVQRAVTS